MEFLKFLESVRMPAATALFELLTWLGEELFIVGALCLIYWCINKKLAYRICFAYFASGLAVQALKITFRIPRPWILDSTFQPVEGALKTATGYSFPSGHTQSATALYGTFLLKEKRRRWRILSLCAIIAVGLSRMYLGVHTPKDVIAAFIVSFVLVWLTNYLTDHKVMERHKRAAALVMVFAGVLTAAYAFLLHGRGIITEKLVSDCVKAAGAGIGFAAGWYIENNWIQFENACASRINMLLRFLIGIAGALACKSGLKLLIGESLPADAIRYALTVLWITCLFPYLIKKCRFLH